MLQGLLFFSSSLKLETTAPSRGGKLRERRWTKIYFVASILYVAYINVKKIHIYIKQNYSWNKRVTFIKPNFYLSKNSFLIYTEQLHSYVLLYCKKEMLILLYCEKCKYVCIRVVVSWYFLLYHARNTCDSYFNLKNIIRIYTRRIYQFFKKVMWTRRHWYIIV